MARVRSALRPATPATHRAWPADTALAFHLREVSTVTHGRGQDHTLWLFGERAHRHRTDDDWAFEAVAVQVHGYAMTVLFECTDFSAETIQSLVEGLNRDVRGGIEGWDVVNMRRAYAFDYARLDHGLQRPHVRLRLRNPNVLFRLRKAFEAPRRDHNDQAYTLRLYHDDWSWGNNLLHDAGVHMNQWVSLPAAAVRAAAAGARQTTCREEYHWTFCADQLTPLADAPNFNPILCAAVRLRISTAGAQAPSLPPPDDEAVRAIVTELYWSGHHGRRVQAVFYVGTDQVDLGGLDADGALRLHVAFRTERQMLHEWRRLCTEVADVDAWITHEDFVQDRVQLLFRVRNLSRFPKRATALPRAGYRADQWWYELPGRSEVDLGAYMRMHMQATVKPRFDAFTQLAAYEHPKMYDGPAFPSLEDHQPFRAATLPLAEVVRQTAIEAEVVRRVEETPSIVGDAVAVQRVTNTPLTWVVQRGQRVRCDARLRRDWFRQGRVQNLEVLRRPLRAVRPVDAAHNHFPDPPDHLPNVPLERRDATYAAAWADAVRRWPEFDRRVLVESQPPPDPPPARAVAPPSPAGAAAGDPGTKRPRAAGTGARVKVQRNLFGQVVTLTTGRKQAKRSRAQPRVKKYAGGLVHDPIPGFYDAYPTFTLDFASLYPSIFMGQKVCWSNWLNDPGGLDDPRLTLMWVPITETDAVPFVTHVDGVPVETVLPQTETELVAERGRVKKLMKAAGQRVERHTDALELKDADLKLDKLKQAGAAARAQADATRATRFGALIEALRDHANYNKQQLGCKIVQNGLYGYTGTPQNGQWLMAVITAIGRWMNAVCKWYTIRYHRGTVIYGDTGARACVACAAGAA